MTTEFNASRTFYLPVNLLQEIDEIAKSESKSQNGLVREILQNFVRNRKKNWNQFPAQMLSSRVLAEKS